MSLDRDGVGDLKVDLVKENWRCSGNQYVRKIPPFTTCDLRGRIWKEVLVPFFSGLS